MRPAVLFLVFAVCKAPSPGPRPAAPATPDPVATLEQPAARLARKGRFDESSRVYRQMAGLRRTSPALCRWEIAVVNNTLASGDKRTVVAEVQRLATLDRTLAAGPMPPDARQACHQAAHDLLAGLVFVWNKEMTRGCTAFSWHNWPLLEVLLHEFLADFPDDARAPEARRALEHLYDLERR